MVWMCAPRSNTGRACARAINIPTISCPRSWPVSKEKQLVCIAAGGRTALAEQTLRAAGFTKLLHLQGDYLAWEAQQRPLAQSPVTAPPPATPR